MLSICYSASHVNGVSGYSSVDEDKKMMLKVYSCLQPIFSGWYELFLGICCRCVLSVEPHRGKDHDAGKNIRFYKDTMRKDAKELEDPQVCTPAH